MGQAKQLLRAGGKTVLERALENLCKSDVDDVVLVLGFSAETIRHALPATLLDRVKTVINDNYREGMASSLRVGLREVSPEIDGALIVMADQPFVRPETIDRIVEAYRCLEGKIVIPFYKGQRGNPVLLDRAVFPEAMALEGDSGCRVIFDRHADDIVRVDVDDEGILLDIDVRQDYERVRNIRI